MEGNVRNTSSSDNTGLGLACGLCPLRSTAFRYQPDSCHQKSVSETVCPWHQVKKRPTVIAVNASSQHPGWSKKQNSGHQEPLNGPRYFFPPVGEGGYQQRPTDDCTYRERCRDHDPSFPIDWPIPHRHRSYGVAWGVKRKLRSPRSRAIFRPRGKRRHSDLEARKVTIAGDWAITHQGDHGIVRGYQDRPSVSPVLRS